MTGATGFLGYHLLRELTSQGVEVVALCREDSPNISRIENMKGVQIQTCALAQIESLPEKLKRGEDDVFYHLAWRGASGSERADYKVQIDNVRWCLESTQAAKKLGVKMFISTGTICEMQCDAIVETEYAGDSAYYLLAKKSAYEMLRVACRRMGLPFLWCTFYHPVGRYNKPEQLILHTIQTLRRGESPKFGPAEKWFDVICAEDLAHAFYLAGSSELKEDRYFIGSGSPRILKDYLLEIQQEIAPELSLEIGAFPDDGLPMRREWLDPSKFVMETGFQARRTFADYLREIKNDR